MLYGYKMKNFKQIFHLHHNWHVVAIMKTFFVFSLGEATSEATEREKRLRERLVPWRGEGGTGVSSTQNRGAWKFHSIKQGVSCWRTNEALRADYTNIKPGILYMVYWDIFYRVEVFFPINSSHCISLWYFQTFNIKLNLKFVFLDIIIRLLKFILIYLYHLDKWLIEKFALT